MRSSATDRASRVQGCRLLRAYPRWWRDRYGDEMHALLEARPPDIRARLDLIRGAADAHVRGAGPEPGRGVTAALIAGGAWTIAGAASVAGPTPPDWPGYLASTLPVAFLGAVALLVATVRLARLAWASSGLSLELAIVAIVVGHLAWAGALAVAMLGGPYGAVTAIAQTMAAIGTIGIGLVLVRARIDAIGACVVAAGAAFLVPTPLAWLAAGALWTAMGLWQSYHARPAMRGDAGRTG